MVEWSYRGRRRVSGREGHKHPLSTICRSLSDSSPGNLPLDSKHGTYTRMLQCLVTLDHVRVSSWRRVRMRTLYTTIQCGIVHAMNNTQLIFCYYSLAPTSGNCILRHYCFQIKRMEIQYMNKLLEQIFLFENLFQALWPKNYNLKLCFFHNFRRWWFENHSF